MTVERVRKILEKDYDINDQEHYEISKIINNDKECFLVFLEFVKGILEKHLQYKNIEIIEGKNLPVGTFLYQKKYNLRGFPDFFNCIQKTDDEIYQKTWLRIGHEIYVTGEPPFFEAFFLWFFEMPSNYPLNSFKNDYVIFIPLGSVEQIISKESKATSVLNKVFCAERPRYFVIPSGDYDFSNVVEKTHPIYNDPGWIVFRPLFCKKGYRNEFIHELISELENELGIE